MAEFEYHLDHPTTISTMTKSIHGLNQETSPNMLLMSETDMINTEPEIVVKDLSYIGNMQMFGILGMLGLTVVMMGARKYKS